MTIIMAVYNSERFLSSAIDSVLGQSFADIELILVNDGSFDNSGAICEEYKRKDNRIIYIEKQNGGVAAARNRCLDIAHGEYVMFVDSDDILYPKALERIYLNLKEAQCDILRFEFNTIDEKGVKLYPNYEANRRKQYNGGTFSPDAFILKILRNELYLCMNVFRRSVLEQHHLRFVEGCSYMEDCDFILRFLLYTRKCKYSSFIGYAYRKHSNSATAKLTEKKYQDILLVFDNLVSLKVFEVKMRVAIKYVYEGIGLMLYENAIVFRDTVTREKIIGLCTVKPIRLEWKLFVLSKNRMWNFLSLIRRVKRKFFY